MIGRDWTSGSARRVPLLAAAMSPAGCDAQPGNQNRPPAPAAGQEVARSAPTRTGYAEVDGARLYYQVYGDLAAGKMPLLILHGAYMSGEAMLPLASRFAATRPVIAIDQRGHGRTGDSPGPITYERLADDAAGVLRTLNVPKADVLGYSTGAGAAVMMAMRHPERVAKLVSVSGTYRRDGWYPVVLKSLASITPKVFAGSPLEAEYQRLSPNPEGFPTLVEKLKVLDASPQEWPEDKMRAIRAETMVIIGDADGVRPEHAVEMFRLRGGGDEAAAAQGFMTEAPRARLAVLPGTSHIGIMAEAGLIVSLVTPFLDSVKPTMPPGFLDEPGAQLPKQPAAPERGAS